MKKLTLLLAAVAAMCLSVEAQEVKQGVFEVGDYTNASEFYNGSYFDMAPTNFYLDHFASQMMYLYFSDFASEFAGKQNVKLTAIYYKFNDQSVYTDILADYKFYLQEVDVNEFQKDADGYKLYFDCVNAGDPAVSGAFEYEAFTSYGEDVEIKVDLSSAPFAITPGKNLVVTAVYDLTGECMSSSEDAPFYTSDIRDRVMTYSDNNDSFLDYANSSDYPRCSLSLSGGGTSVSLPVTRIEYSYTEGGSTSKRGDVNKDGSVSIADVTALIDYLLSGDDTNVDVEAANCNLSEDGVNIADVTALIDFLLGGTW